MMKRTVFLLLLIPALFSCRTTIPGPELLAPGVSRTITLAAFNDFHGALDEDPLGKNPGAAKLAREVADLRLSQPDFLLLSAGDNYQGSALSNLTKGQVVSQVFRRMGVAASAVGNHEFDWGDGLFPTWSADGGFPFLAANIVEKATGQVPSWARPYALFRVGGHRVAVIGLSTLDTLSSTKAENLERYRFLDPAETARTWVNRLKVTDRPELIVALTHVPGTVNLLARTQVAAASGAGELDRLSRVAGLDLIITGHSHQSYAGTSNGVPVVQAGSNGRSLALVTVTFRADGTKKVAAVLDEVWKNKADLPEEPGVRALIDDHTDRFGAPLGEKAARLEEALAHFDDLRSDQNLTPMGRWVCDVLREKFGTQVAVMNGGGLRKGFAAGPVYVKDFWELMPFDNTAVTFQVTGADLRKILDHGIDSPDFRPGQFSGVTAVYRPEAPYGRKIVALTLADGTPVEDTGLYSVVTNDFLFGGGDQYDMVKPAARNAVDTYLPIRDLLLEAARKAGTLTVPAADGLKTK